MACVELSVVRRRVNAMDALAKSVNVQAAPSSGGIGKPCPWMLAFVVTWVPRGEMCVKWA
eukprot:scaffold54230_cov28-Tisochrysis_lutea.AAC.4